MRPCNAPENRGRVLRIGRRGSARLLSGEGKDTITQLGLAGERHPGKAAAPPAGRFADDQHGRAFRKGGEITEQVTPPDGVGVGPIYPQVPVVILVEQGGWPVLGRRNGKNPVFKERPNVVKNHSSNTLVAVYN